jgi:hypothetical protein
VRSNEHGHFHTTRILSLDDGHIGGKIEQELLKELFNVYTVLK